MDKNLAIVGPGAGSLAVDGNAASRVFHTGANTLATISGLTIIRGYGGVAGGDIYAGGGIYNDHARLTVSNCTLSGNSTVSYGRGGGICNDGHGGSATLQIVNSTLSGNSAGTWGAAAPASTAMAQVAAPACGSLTAR